MMSVRGLLGGCLVLYLFSFIMALRENCCSPNFYTCCLAGRKTEVFAFVAEVLGITAMLLFSVDEYETRGDFTRLSWGHALCDFGLAVSLIGSIMMACSQHSLSPILKNNPAASGGGGSGGRMAAKPQGYESLANTQQHQQKHRGSFQGCSTAQASPFTGRSLSRVSGPIPSQAAIAAITAAVSPKQQRLGGGGGGGGGMSSLPTSPLHRKMSSPASYPALDPLSSSSSLSSPMRRKASAQSFAGVQQQQQQQQQQTRHQHHFLSRQQTWEGEDWRMQQSATWSEDMMQRGVEGGRAWAREMLEQEHLYHHHQQQQQQQQQRQQENARASHHHQQQHHQHQQLQQQQEAATWGAVVERERSWTHNVHGDRVKRTTSGSDHYGPPHFRMPASKSYSSEHHHYNNNSSSNNNNNAARGSPRLPPSASYSEHPPRLPPTSSSPSLSSSSSPSHVPPSPTHYGSPGHHKAQQLSVERKQARLMYQFSDPGYPPPPPQPVRQLRRLSSSQQEEQQRRNSGGAFVDPPLEELEVYEEERFTDTLSYHGYSNPIPGEEPGSSPKRLAQPVVLYHNPLHHPHHPQHGPQHPHHSPLHHSPLGAEAVTMSRSLLGGSSPYARSTLPNMTSSVNRQSLLQQEGGQQHQTFPRQHATYLAASMHAYVS